MATLTLPPTNAGGQTATQEGPAGYVPATFAAALFCPVYYFFFLLGVSQDSTYRAEELMPNLMGGFLNFLFMVPRDQEAWRERGRSGRHGFRVRFLGLGICDLFCAVCDNDSWICLMRFIPVNRWVVLGKSDIVPADLAEAAAAAGHPRLNFSPLPMIPIWYELGIAIFFFVCFFCLNSEAQNRIGIMCLTCSMFLSQGADGPWGRGLHGCAVLQEGQEDRRYVQTHSTASCRMQNCRW